MNEKTPLLTPGGVRGSRRRASRVSRESVGSQFGVDAADLIQHVAVEVADEDDDDDGDDLYPRPDASPVAAATRQLLILTVLMIATLSSSLAVCLFPPFFPRIAERAGWSSTVYGFIIGTNCLTSFIVTPFIGSHVSDIRTDIPFCLSSVPSKLQACYMRPLQYVRA